MTEQALSHPMTQFTPWTPRDEHLCELQRLTCPRCGNRLSQSNVHFFAPGGLLRCQHRPQAGHAECGAMLYVLPWPENRIAYVRVATMAQIQKLDRFPVEHGREITPRDILLELGAVAMPASPMNVERK